MLAPVLRGGLAIPTLLSFHDLRSVLRATFGNVPDNRTSQNRLYTFSDAALGAFSVFFTQTPSFLAYQRQMQQHQGRNNAGSLFGIERIPGDSHIRNLLDMVAPEHVQGAFWDIFALVSQAGYLSDYEFEGSVLLSVDGTGYFGSSEIHCPNCTVAMHGGKPYYTHTALLPVLVRPGKAEVIALEPEFITPQDGAEKQDCERNAAKRWITRNTHHLVGQRVTVLADDLHCNQPFCQLLLDHEFDFVMTCKPDSHQALYEEVAALNAIGAVTEITDRVWTGHGHERRTYRYVNHVPLRADAKTLMVNWCEITVVDETTGDVRYRNAFATNRILSDDTVRPVVAAGRARWKVENENNNVLKNQGYHLEHNYGHGKKHLSHVLLMLILLAFLCHTVLQLADDKYQYVRAILGTRKTFFDDIRALTRYMFFESWEHLLDFMMAGLERSPG
jgi:hypothetical protein